MNSYLQLLLPTAVLGFRGKSQKDKSEKNIAMFWKNFYGIVAIMYCCQISEEKKLRIFVT